MVNVIAGCVEGVGAPKLNEGNPLKTALNRIDLGLIGLKGNFLVHGRMSDLRKLGSQTFSAENFH